MQEMQVWSLGQEGHLEKEMATHSSILAWEIPWKVRGVTKCWTQWVNEPFWYCMFCGLGQIHNDTYSPLYTIQYFPSPKDPCVLPIHLSPPLQFLRPLWHLLFIQISNLCSLCITRGMCHFSKNLPKPLFLENNLAVCIYYFIPIFYGCRSCILLCLTG